MNISIVLSDEILGGKAWHNPARFKLFVTLLFSVNQAESDVDGVVICRGEMLTSISRLAKLGGLTIKQVRNALAALCKAGYITTLTTHRYTLVKVCNYDNYVI